MRSPVYSFNRFDETGLAELLADGYFLAALKMSSEDVYVQLEDIAFDHARLSTRMKYTLLRYFNRMCFRPTPFGINSTVCRVAWGKDDELRLEQIVNVVIQPGFPEMLKAQPATIRDGVLVTNRSIYNSAGSALRYLKVVDEGNNKYSYPFDGVVLKAIEHAAEDFGATDILFKPFDTRLLIVKINTYLSPMTP